jgi:hypothetical protein
MSSTFLGRRLLALAFLCAVPALATAAPIHGHLVGPGVISSSVKETSIAITPDRTELYFMRSDFAESNDTILVTRRTAHGWGTPRVAPFSGVWHDSEPTLTPDGRRLYFVSNRPIHAGGKPLTATMGSTTFPGTKLWYVQRTAHGWSTPIHVDAALNDTHMIYNPSVAANGDIYYSAHRADSGRYYQIYVARRTAHGYAAPQRVMVGDPGRNHMDPAIDPRQRFIVFAGNEGDAIGSADVYIAFRQPDGSWGTPVHLPADINSRYLENAPVLGRHFGTLYVASQRPAPVHYPKPRDTYASLMKTLHGPLNGSRNLWRFDIGALLRAHGIRD